MTVGDNSVLHDVCTLTALYERALRRFPSRVALVDRRESLTYAQLAERAARYAAVFRSQGLGRGNALAQLSTNRVDAVAVLIAALVCGMRYTPLHPRGSVDDHAFIVQDAEIDALVVDEESFAGVADAVISRSGRQTRVFSFEPAHGQRTLRALADSASTCGWSADSHPEDIAFIGYTGGTTGRPKGVVHRHRSLVANTLMELAEFEWPDEVRFLAVTPISHAAFAFLLPVLLKGGTLVLEEGFSPAGFFSAVARHGVTATFLVPTLLNALLDSPELPTANLGSLRMIVYGASPIAPARLRQALARFGSVFVQLYGQTEAPNVICVLRRCDHDDLRPERLMSCGIPLAGLDVRLLDDQGAEVAQGEVGEICVRGPLVMEGYWKRSEETAVALAGGWLHTGDMAVADEEGYLTIVDRKKDVIISGGFNVYPREVEDVLASHPHVTLAAVIGVPDPKWGEAVKAVIQLRAGTSVSATELIELVRRRKGAVAAPKSIDFVDSVPLTAIGKVDKKALRAVYWHGRERQVN